MWVEKVIVFHYFDNRPEEARVYEIAFKIALRHPLKKQKVDYCSAFNGS